MNILKYETCGLLMFKHYMIEKNWMYFTVMMNYDSYE